MPVIGAFLVPHPPVIVPEVGRGREREIARTAESYRETARRVAELDPDTVVIFTPHATMYSDYIHISPGEGASGSLGRFGARTRMSVRYDEELADLAEALCAAQDLPAGTLGEQDPGLDHGVLVPLHFLGQQGGGFRLLRVAPSGLPRRDHYRFGMLLRRAADELGRRLVVIASGDLSHKLREDGPYGFAPEGPRLDEAICGILTNAVFDRLLTLDESLCRKGAECGLLPLILMAGALDGHNVQARLHSYEGPFGVGYAVASFQPGSENPDRRFLLAADRVEAQGIDKRRAAEDPYVRLARATLEHYVCTGELPPTPDDLPGELTARRAGVFVSIKKHGELRGCIGTIRPAQSSVAQEIRRNAISSGTEDPRFPAVRADELPQLTYSVDVLADPEPCTREQLDHRRYGVIVTAGARRGLLLPNLEGVDSPDEQINIALNKAGIRPDEEFTLQRFDVLRHL